MEVHDDYLADIGNWLAHYVGGFPPDDQKLRNNMAVSIILETAEYLQSRGVFVPLSMRAVMKDPKSYTIMSCATNSGNM